MVRRLERDRFFWRVERGGREYESILQIVLRIPNRRLAWRTVSGAESSGVVAIDPLPGNQTLVSFKMKFTPGAGWGDAVELQQRVRKRLENFKSYIESLPLEGGDAKTEKGGTKSNLNRSAPRASRGEDPGQ